MTFMGFRERSKDLQDNLERHIYGELEYHDAGSIIKVKGTDSGDEEVTVLTMGVGNFKLKKDHDAEVFLLASSSDTQLKVAVLQIPFDKQRRWPEGEGGIQHPTDPEVSVHISDKLTHVTKNKMAVGEKGEFEVKGNEAYFRVSKLIVDGELIVNKKIKTPNLEAGTETPPKFEGNKQEEKKQASGGGGGGTPTQFELDFGNAN